MGKDIEFGRKDDADVARDEHEEWLCSEDDRRLKTVRFASDTPDRVLELVRAKAAQSRQDTTGSGQAALTDDELDRIDFSQPRANVPWAQAIKAYAMEKGVDDWTAHLDGTLEVDENKGIIDSQAGSETSMREITQGATGTGAQRGGGMNVDRSLEDELVGGKRRATDEELARVEQAQAEQCDHAEGHCEHGDPEACEFLQDHCGYTDEEIDAILSEPDDVQEEISGEAAGALQRSWGGYKAAIARLARLLDEAAEAKGQAERAGAAINAIRADHGQDPMEFERLEELSDRLVDAGDTAHDAEGHIERHA